MMFESLSQKINQAIQRIKGADKITPHNISTTLKEIRRALIEADVPYKIAKEFVQEVKEKALGHEVQLTISPGQLFTKIVQDQLVALMGKEATPLSMQGNPSLIFLVGLQGAGKTTLAGKLARYLKEKNRSVLLVGCDVYRPAAGEQLRTLGESIGVPVYTEPDEKDAKAILEKALQEAKKDHQKVIIVDTAGRQAIDESMMQELVELKQAFQPQETLFVVDAMIGQVAIETIEAFHEKVKFDGVVLTKMDSDTRGGVALAIRKSTGQPIKMLSTGEKLSDLETFHPERMAKRILGMVDVVSLVERAQKTFDEKNARQLNKKLSQNKFDFNDFQAQIRQLKKIGSIKSLLAMAIGKQNLDLDLDEESKLDEWSVMISSMTPYERENPDIIKESRRQRITLGCGLPRDEVNKMFKQFEFLSIKFNKFRKKGNHSLNSFLLEN